MRNSITHSLMREVDLSGANLEGVVMGRVRWRDVAAQNARFGGISIQNSDISGLSITGSTFGLYDTRWPFWVDSVLAFLDARDVAFEEVRLNRTQLVLSDLRGADFSGTTWSSSKLVSTLVHGADFSSARDLTQESFDNVVGDETTLLPPGNAPDTGEPFYVNSCMVHRAPAMDFLLNEVAKRDGKSFREVRAALICPDGGVPGRITAAK